MTIPEIKLTQEEMKQAVGAFLVTKGINVPVESVDKNYSGSGGFKITLVDPDDVAPVMPEIQPITTTLAPAPTP